MPAAGRRQRIDAGLPSRDRDGAGRHQRPGHVPPWQLELFGQRPEVSPARDEADQEHAIDRLRVKLGDPLWRQFQPRGDLFEVLSLVYDRNPMKPAGLRHRWTLNCEPLDGRAQCVVRGLVWVEMNSHGGITGDRLAHVSSLLQRSGERDGPRVQRCVELGA